MKTKTTKINKRLSGKDFKNAVINYEKIYDDFTMTQCLCINNYNAKQLTIKELAKLKYQQEKEYSLENLEMIAIFERKLALLNKLYYQHFYELTEVERKDSNFILIIKKLNNPETPYQAVFRKVILKKYWQLKFADNL